MKIKEINEPIASRKLFMGDANVIVVIGKPEQIKGEYDYFCPYSIEYPDCKRVSSARGVDAVQAMQLTLKKISVDLECFSKSKNEPISWFEDTVGETGFP